MSNQFNLSGEYIELIKLLKATGLCSTGGEAKSVTVEGLVKVDGNVELRKKRKIRRGQIVEFQNQIVEVI